jgi:hypothetical protein
MRLHEFTSAEEQLGLLRVIIDSTWRAIAQQAAEQRRAEEQRRIAASKVPRARRSSSSKASSVKLTTSPQSINNQISAANTADNDDSDIDVTSSSPTSPNQSPSDTNKKDSKDTSSTAGINKNVLIGKTIDKKPTIFFPNGSGLDSEVSDNEDGSNDEDG